MLAAYPVAPVNALQMTFDLVGPYGVPAFLANVYFELMEQGRHPWNNSKLSLIPKLGRDPSTEKGWRPIAVLPVLGKGMERCIASRLERTGPARGWFGPKQAGGIPGRSAIDICRTVVKEIERRH